MKDEIKMVGVFKLKLELLNQYSLQEEEENRRGVLEKWSENNIFTNKKLTFSYLGSQPRTFRAT